jgi:mono/diheme cytochrome c family protein
MPLRPPFLKSLRSAAASSVVVTTLLMAQASAQSQKAAASVVARGEYLAQAGDCVACHTAPGGKLFAGGRAMPTPFGTLYTSNVTPDGDTGIGKWTADQFYSMMHTGRSPDGGLLYPAMPFGSYTKITRADSDAIFAFMQSVPPIKLQNRPHDLKFPYNNRSLIIGWRTLFFTEGEYKPDSTKSEEWNRGAYLVQGLGHCAMCHTAINALGGSSESAAFEGGLIPMQNWYAPSLTSNKEGGLGDWSIEDISDLLRTGISNRGAVYGPMADVTYNSLQHMTEADTRAMAVYLKSLAEHSVLDAPRPTTSAQESSLCCGWGRRSTPTNARAVTATRGSGSRLTIRRSRAINQSRCPRPSTRCGWFSMAVIRRALQAIRCLTECHPSHNRSRMTRSRRS